MHFRTWFDVKFNSDIDIVYTLIQYYSFPFKRYEKKQLKSPKEFIFAQLKNVIVSKLGDSLKKLEDLQ